MDATALRTRALPADLAAAWRRTSDRWRELDGTARLWRRDASLFTGGDEGRWLGWLELPHRPLDPLLDRLAAEVRAAGIRRVVLLGMGGSSLGAEALVANLGGGEALPAFTVLDTTEPIAVAAALAAADREPTFVIAASKSGGTLETELLLRVFSQRVPPERLAVITDPGSKLERWAQAGGSRWLLHGDPQVGGRFSVLSSFGLAAPRALGLPVDGVLAGARRAAEACRADGSSNPGVALGALFAASADSGRMLLTVLAGTPATATFADWLEQLVAESLGKAGRGLLPIVGERVAGPNQVLDQQDARLVLAVEPSAPPTAELEARGMAVVSLELGPEIARAESLGFELFRWELATAVAGALLGVHPFDQPDVEAAKLATHAWIERAESGEALSAGVRVGSSDGLVVYSVAGTARTVAGTAQTVAGTAQTVAEPAPATHQSVASAIDAELASAETSRFCALLAFLPGDAASRVALERLRAAVAARSRLATTVGLGPRYLHSTGQFHKGGGDHGVYLVLARAVGAVPASAAGTIPGHASSFAQVHAAQALGDFEALTAKGRHALLLELSGDVPTTLERLAAVLEALPPRGARRAC
jgi:transaldolase/glucose-6-phosphate isomerase